MQAGTPILAKVGKGRHVCVRVPNGDSPFSRSAWVENIANAWLPCTNMVKGSIQKRESKFFQVKSLVSIHSACPCKNYVPKYSQTPHELDYLIIYLFNC